MKFIEPGCLALVISNRPGDPSLDPLIYTAVTVIERDDDSPEHWVVESPLVRQLANNPDITVLFPESQLRRIDGHDSNEDIEETKELLEGL